MTASRASAARNVGRRFSNSRTLTAGRQPYTRSATAWAVRRRRFERPVSHEANVPSVSCANRPVRARSGPNPARTLPSFASGTVPKPASEDVRTARPRVDYLEPDGLGERTDRRCRQDGDGPRLGWPFRSKSTAGSTSECHRASSLEVCLVGPLSPVDSKSGAKACVHTGILDRLLPHRRLLGQDVGVIASDGR